MKTILLTGASGGIGATISKQLKQGGNEVIEVNHKEVDLASYSDVLKLEKKVSAKEPSIDWIICAHGFIDTIIEFERQEPEIIDQIFKVNTLSLFYIAKIFLKHLRPGGGIIFISSTAGLQANGFFPAYSASKAAVNSFSQALARNQSKFNFYSICPGPTNTKMREKIAGDAATMQNPSIVADVISDIILERGNFKSGDIISIHNSIVSKVSEIS
jgi:short-subunit dehydrogenase